MIGPASVFSEPWIVAGIVAFAVLAAAAVWLVPRQQAKEWKAKGITGKELAELENGARVTIVQIIGGIALLLTFAATWTQIADTRKATNETLHISELQQENDRFTAAVQDLGSNNATLRLGGIYSLQRLAQISANERPPVVQLMVAYLHRNHPVTSSPYKGAYKAWDGDACSDKWRPAPDTEAALNAILEFRRAHRPIDLSMLDLNAVRIQNKDLSYADLRGSSLYFAHADGANFYHGIFFRSWFKDACFPNARFVHAELDGSHDMKTADYAGANFARAHGAP